jgi:hypothetical protein
MRFPQHLLKASTYRSEPLIAAMAAVAVGMFVGTWILGPALTHNSPRLPRAAAPQERTTFEAMVARPDPMPYRAPTPAFDTAGQPTYAAAAKEKAPGGIGRTGRSGRGCRSAGLSHEVIARLPRVRPAQSLLSALTSGWWR